MNKRVVASLPYVCFTFMLSWFGDADVCDCDLTLESSCLDDENDGLGMDHLYTYTQYAIVINTDNYLYYVYK